MSYNTLTPRERALIARLKEAKQQRDIFLEGLQHEERVSKKLREDVERLKTAKLQINEILQEKEGYTERRQIKRIEETFDGLRIFIL